jgi:hypothetical protein
VPPFATIWALDFEFRIRPGGWPHVVCLVAHELHSGRELRLGREDLLARYGRPPFDVDHDLFAGFYASAEWSCFLQLGWRLPRHVVDLYVEHRAQTNGLPQLHKAKPKGAQTGKAQKSEGRDSLLSALAMRGLAHIDAGDKDRMRSLIMSTENPTPESLTEILDYCSSDVVGTAALFRYMVDHEQIDWPRALWRGRYTCAVARMEHTGVPIDVHLHERLSASWAAIRHALVVDVNRTFPVFDADDTFKSSWFAELVARNKWPWPMLPSGALDLTLDTFNEMARFHPELRPLYEVRASLGETRLTGLGIGPDARNRCLLSMFQTVTGRNAPSASRFIFGPARWMRGLIKSSTHGLAYLDWQSQEFLIAGASRTRRSGSGAKLWS